MLSKLSELREKIMCSDITSTAVLILSIWLVMGGVIAKGMLSHTFLDVALLILFLVSVFIVVSAKIEKRIMLSKNIKLWGIILVTFMVLNLFPELLRLIQGERYIGHVVGFVERYLLVTLFLFMSLAVFYKKTDAVVLFKLLIVSSLWILLVLIGEISYVINSQGDSLSSFRVGGIYSSGVIDFGVYSNMLFITLLGAIPWLRKISRSWVVAWFLSLMVCLSGTLLSQSRTAWIGWPEALIGWVTFYFYYFKNNGYMTTSFSSRYSKIAAGLISFLAIFILMFGYQLIESRVGKAVDDVESYMHGSPMNSLGMRFLMYDIAVDSLKDTAKMGMGVNNFKPYLNQASKQVLNNKFHIESEGLTFSHIHNQFLMTWLTEGVLALISLVTIFAFLLIYYIRMLKCSLSYKQRALAVTGLVLTVASFMSFMPESPLNFKATFIFFFVLNSLVFVVNEVEKNIEELQES